MTASTLLPDTSSIQFAEGSWQEVVWEVLVGLYTGVSMCVQFGHMFLMTYIGEPLGLLLGWNTKTKTKQTNTSEPAGLKVVGIGYGRTGTYSLTLALEKLGYPTLHTMHLYETENDAIFQMWADDIFGPSLASGKAELGRPNFDVIVSQAQSHYQATTDLPMALYFEQIHEAYPDCKFILTTRDSSEIWFRSWDTLTKSITQPTRFGGTIFGKVRNYSNYLRWLFAIVNRDDSYLWQDFPLKDQNPQRAIQSYEEHNQRVRETIPASQLLEYNVKQGWEPLCEFLEIREEACPSHTHTPFPRSNSARSVQVQSLSSFAVPFALVLFIVFYAFTVLFTRLTQQTVLGWLDCQFHALLELVQHKATTSTAKTAAAPTAATSSSAATAAALQKDKQA